MRNIIPVIKNCLNKIGLVKNSHKYNKKEFTPNEVTIKAMEDARAGIGLIKCKSVDDLFRQLELEEDDNDV